MARSKVPSFFEPWRAVRSSTWDIPFQFGPPKAFDEDAVARWHSEKARAEANADWLIWGSRMGAPDACTSLLTGKVNIFPTERIIAVAENRTIENANPGHEAIARRIASCVTACAGIADPEDTIRRTRELLLAFARGEADRGDDRVIALLGRMIPPDELQEFDDDEG